jgi:hypothetical protein
MKLLIIYQNLQRWALTWASVQYDFLHRKRENYKSLEMKFSRKCLDQRGMKLLIIYGRCAQIQGDLCPWPLNLLRWGQIFVAPQHWTCFISGFWCLEFWGGVCIVRNICRPGSKVLLNWEPYDVSMHTEFWGETWTKETLERSKLRRKDNSNMDI